jgi:hypothetical protein
MKTIDHYLLTSLRERAAKKAEKWIFGPEWTETAIRKRQNDVAQEIADAIRAMPLDERRK